MTIHVPAEIARMRDEGALFAVSHSAGKDSQTMLLKVIEAGVPMENIILIHADLGDVEWAGNIAHIEENGFGLPLIVARPKSSFWDMVNRRQMFPSPSHRQCTSDLKRGPIQRELRRYLKANPRFNGKVVNCMGMRAEESPARKKLDPCKRSEANSKAGREWWDWLPIHAMTTIEVFQTIYAAGQLPHPAYRLGMKRLSCCFCIMACQSDLTISARANPELYARYVAKEIEIDHTLSMSRKFLPEVTGLTPEEALATAVRLGEGPDRLAEMLAEAPDQLEMDFELACAF